MLTKKIYNNMIEKKIEEECNKRKEREKYLIEQSKFDSMGEMINNIAHQWRQPLANINSIVTSIDINYSLNTLSKELLDEKLTQIENQTKYMSQTIEDFRRFFHPNKKKDLFFVSQAIMDAISIAKLSLEAKKINLIFKKRDDIEIEGFSKEFTQSIIIIINNAIDALVTNNITNPKIKIYLSIIRKKIFITIKDNACGIQEEIKDKIFDPYFTTKHQTQGTGLGLYICKVIVENSLGGILCLKNSKNGAKFIIII